MSGALCNLRNLWILVADGLEAGADACARQGDAESCAVTRCAVDSYSPGVFLHDAIRHCEPEAGSLSDAFRRVERIVDLRDVLGCDADTRIGNLCDERSIIGCIGCDDNSSAVGNRITRVQDQISEDLLQLTGVSVSLGRVLVVASNDLDLAETQLRFE